jgi:HEPN domain-containing protein
MDDARRTPVRQWLDKAERDLASAVRLLEGEPPFPDTAVYHCQQAGEKALKAFLASRDRPVRRVHDLVVLADECSSLDGSLAGLAEAAEILTPYGTAFRYPGDLTEPECHVELRRAARSVQTIGSRRARLTRPTGLNLERSR